MCLGNLIGFIFSIGSNKSANPLSSAKAAVSNDNLVQISDWLTKAIVVIFLLEVYRMPEFFSKLARIAGPPFSNLAVGWIV